jgi:hypothetical protein
VPGGALEAPTSNPVDLERVIRIDRERAAAYRDSVALVAQSPSFESFARAGRDRMNDYRARARALMGR